MTYSIRTTKNYICAITIVIAIAIIFFYYTQSNVYDHQKEFVLNNGRLWLKNNQEKYLINTPTCRIPNDDPFNEDVKKFYKHVNYFQCFEKSLLTYIEKHDSVVTLFINQSVVGTYSPSRISCCYLNVSHISTQSFSECHYFENSINVTQPLIFVRCESSEIEVYSNVHAILTPEMVKEKLLENKFLNTSHPFSVLLVGMDSMSKMNLIRTMPKTYEFLEGHDFINLKGYTKIGLNTFPNLIAILSGKLWTQVYEDCHPDKYSMDDCGLIWDTFSQLGYITAYAEDETCIDTFYYGRKGFEKPPVDFYFRPYVLLTEMLLSVKKNGLHACTGPESPGERIMNLARDFQKTFENIPKFGLFWMNSFSHNDLNFASSMDEKVEIFLKDIYGHLNNTVFIFLSDHGFRFGGIRYTHTGWLEERLPFIYVHLPKSFKDLYRQEFKNFKTNSRRLTSPFDLYMTLQDILYFAANQNYFIAPSLGCPKCHSLFKEVSENRRCKDAGIERNWCLCLGHSYIDPTNKIVVETAKFIVSEINTILKSSKDGNKCAQYFLKNVVFSGMSEEYLNDRNKSVNYLLVMLKTSPSAVFEATVEVSANKSNFRIMGEISRTNWYGDNSKCVEGLLEKYCYCGGFFTFIENVVYKFWT